MAQAELFVAAAKGPPDESAVSGRLQAADYAARVYVGLKTCGGRGRLSATTPWLVAADVFGARSAAGDFRSA